MEWPRVRLGDVVSLEYGKPLTANARDPRGKFPVAGSNGPHGRHTSAIVSSPGIVVGRKGSAGKVYWYEEDFWPIDTTYYVVPKTPLDIRWMYFRLRHLQLNQLATTTGVPGLNRNDVYKIEIGLPPVSEQNRIVDILDQADRLRRLRAEADAKTKRIMPALFIKMFGDPVTNPMRWPFKRFDSICESRLGKMLDQKQQTGRHRRSYLRNANVYWDRLDLREVLEMDFDEADRDEFKLRKGDVLICEGGEVGRCAIWNDELPECYFQKALHRARPFPSTATSEYIVFLFLLLAQRGALLDAASKVTFSHLTGVKLKALQIPVPPFALQEEFSVHVRVTKTALAETVLAPKKMSSLFSGLLQHAFSGTLFENLR